MNKQNLRSLGVGFLGAALITVAFAIFLQGNMPTSMAVSDLFTNNARNNSGEVESLQAERDALSSQADAFSESVASLQKENSEQASQLASLSRSNQSSALRSEGVSESSQNENTDNNTSETASNNQTNDEPTGELTEAQPEITGNFTIEPGSNSLEIANQLEAAGYIDSASEFQALLDEWSLSTMIVADTYQLNSDMSIHDIASLITHGAYYYY